MPGELFSKFGLSRAAEEHGEVPRPDQRGWIFVVELMSGQSWRQAAPAPTCTCGSTVRTVRILLFRNGEAKTA
ncbi:hypothetical protein TgHK011_000281 [Trichoderma gracile]|nr:hypothetical protein TgHK011_000281 [Trichoderma gracile]